MCGALRPADSGKKAVLMGWVNRRRDLGNLIFIDLRDRTGVTQVVFNKELNPAAHAKAETLRNEYVLAVIGQVKRRDPATFNKNIPTGEIEVMTEELRILNESKQPPFLPGDTVLPNEEMRLKYRYIDLRREAMQFNLQMRHNVSQAIRGYFCQQGFLEIETPFMTRSTPEGARDYLVPSRVQPGSFYALPQSPQMFKQILMISGCERYFQIVRCFRDEDLRADRQPEFTQIDLEMSYPQAEQVYAVVEGFLTAAFKAAGHEIKTPFLRMTYDESMRLYGNDKPDMRLPAMVDVRAALTPEELEEVTTKFRIRKELPWQLIRIPKGWRHFRHGAPHHWHAGGPYQHVQGPSFVQLMTDPKRFAKDYPAISERVLKFAKVEPDDLWLLAGALQPSRRSRGRRADQNLQHFCEKVWILAARPGAEIRGETRRIQEDGRRRERFPVLVGHRLSHVCLG